jgi:hypothetical protein
MKAHDDKYDDLLMRERSEVVCDLPVGSDTSKVRSGEVGAHRMELSDGLLAELDATWAETIAADLGIQSYEMLLEMLAAGVSTRGAQRVPGSPSVRFVELNQPDTAGNHE